MEEQIEFGKPFTPMKPLYADKELKEVLEDHGGKTNAEIKEDGYRCVAHVDKDVMELFTYNQNEYILACYPEITESLKKLKLEKTIIDCELKGTSTGFAGFQEIKKRFKAKLGQKGIEDYLKSGKIKEIPLELVVFDTLMHKGKGISQLPLEERRRLTETFHEKNISPSKRLIISSAEDLQKLYQTKVVEEKNEGLVLKDLKSPHRINKKTKEWIKVKRFETLDLIIVGLYQHADYEEEQKLPFYGALCGTYNEKTGLYETIGKVSLSRKDEETDTPFAIEIQKRIKKFRKTCPNNVAVSPKIESEKFADKKPTLYINPEDSVVLEIKAMNLQLSDNWQTCGLKDGKAYSMRIAWVKNIREDKNHLHVSTTSLVETLYKQQGEIEE
ncbi:hypothetical protein HY643_01350 [Candidatus Woesearchaeota archaeon]|nr:hypothetical protein [Candidatus Woesearchaeota archaeon]